MTDGMRLFRDLCNYRTIVPFFSFLHLDISILITSIKQHFQYSHNYSLRKQFLRISTTHNISLTFLRSVFSSIGVNFFFFLIQTKSLDNLFKAYF